MKKKPLEKFVEEKLLNCCLNTMNIKPLSIKLEILRGSYYI